MGSPVSLRSFHRYQLWSLGLMFVGQKGCSRARVGSVGKREDLKTPLLGGTDPGPRSAHLGVQVWSLSSLFLPEGFPGLWSAGAEG